jgi:hypothetical protein
MDSSIFTHCFLMAAKVAEISSAQRRFWVWLPMAAIYLIQSHRVIKSRNAAPNQRFLPQLPVLQEEMQNLLAILLGEPDRFAKFAARLSREDFFT